jgi:hypothetical protein
MPNIQVDGGTKRRIRACPHNSKFVDEECDVNIQKNIFLKDEEFEQYTELKNAFFKILATRAHEWLKTKKIKLPDSFTELTENIIGSNDHMNDFIEGSLIKTDNDNDRIGKFEMLKMYSTMYPNKHLTMLQLQSLLKDRNVKYDRKLRSNKIQGSFIGVKTKDPDDLFNHDEDDLDHGIENEDKKTIIELKLIIEKLTNQLNESKNTKVSK